LERRTRPKAENSGHPRRKAMNSTATVSGLPGVGDVNWGAHVCHFYRTREDLVDSLVPFFKAGLEHNESCLWVTSEPFRAVDARSALKEAVPNLDARMKKGQIQIIDHEEWYTKSGNVDADSIVNGWVQRTNEALAAGFNGLRLTGNLYWLKKEDWRDFVQYEQKVNETFRHHRMIALCSYCMSQCGHEELFDVVRNHDYALVRREGEWEHIENSSLKIAKEELRQLAEQLEQRVAERTAELEAALRTRDEFLSVASHELKTPVASLQLYVETMLRASERKALSLDDVPSRLSKAKEQCHRLDKLISNLLDVSRASNAGLTLTPEDVDLTAVVRDTVERLEDDLKSAGCRVHLQAQGPLVGRWDKLRLEQVVTNLLTNAIRHAPGQNVDVSVVRAGAYAQLVVRDNGPGIKPEDQARIFQRFVQAPSGRAHGGFGLGLWIVKEISEAHGGSVHLVSAPGRGACFTVSLPLHRQ
jgi:signal transduction histidine kinase